MSETRNTGQPAGAGIFFAADLRRRMAERNAARTAEELRRMQAQEEQQKAVMAEFQRPPARTPEQLIPLVMQLSATPPTAAIPTPGDIGFSLTWK